MKAWLHKLEIIVDKSIPFLLVILLFIIIGEFWFHELIEHYRTAADIIDSFIIAVFVIDLCFKYNRIRNFPKFLRASWLDILAIFPFFLIFRIIEGSVGVIESAEVISRTQKVVHVGLEIEPEVGKVLKEGELFAKEASRAERFGRFLRPLTRGIRFLKLGNPRVERETKRDLKKGNRFIRKETKMAEKEMKKLPRHFKAALFFEKPKIMRYISRKWAK